MVNNGRVSKFTRKSIVLWAKEALKSPEALFISVPLSAQEQSDSPTGVPCKPQYETICIPKTSKDFKTLQDSKQLSICEIYFYIEQDV